MATIITLPAIHGLDKEKCFPKGQERLWNYFSVDIYNVKHSKIFRPHLFMPTNEVNLSYQKMIPKFEFIKDIEPDLPCDPLCPEGWYFDCETETCKEYDHYVLHYTKLHQTATSAQAGVTFSLEGLPELDSDITYDLNGYDLPATAYCIDFNHTTYTASLVINSSTNSFILSITHQSVVARPLGDCYIAELSDLSSYFKFGSSEESLWRTSLTHINGESSTSYLHQVYTGYIEKVK